jgi:TPR repeat protein
MKSVWMAALASTCLIAGVVSAVPAAAQDASQDPVKQGVDAWERGDYKTAVERWRGPAIAGNPDAQFNLGQAYKLGRGVPADLNMAEEWYRKAAMQGHPQAEDNYGLALFQNGKRAEALVWLEKSAARGEPRAQFVLGTMYFNGDGVERDWVRAYALIVRASQSGLPQASTALAQMDKYISLQERQQGLAHARTNEEQANRHPPVDYN